MPTATVDPKRIVELQDTPDPDTGEFRSLAEVAEQLTQECGYRVKRAAVHMAARRYRTKHGLPPAPNTMRKGHFPWTVPDEAHRDPTGYALHRIARIGLAEQAGEECNLHPDERKAVDRFWRYLRRQGPHAVIAWDAEACRGVGGWLVRHQEPGEEVWHGCMAVKPRPE